MASSLSTAQGSPHGPGTTALLLRAVRGESERISVGEIIDALDARAFGLATLIFALPSCVPMPPGVPTVVGVALLVVSIQMVIGRSELRLPRFISRHTFPRTPLVAALEKITPWMERRIERLARPRLLPLTGRLGTMVIGLVILIMAIVLILPLPPGGNLPPALACAVLGVGMAERDGVIVLFGMIVSIAATIAVWAVTLSFIKYLPVLTEWAHRSFGG